MNQRPFTSKRSVAHARPGPLLPLLAIALTLAALVALFYALTMAKLGPQVLNRPL